MTGPSDPNPWRQTAQPGSGGRLSPLRVMQIIEIGVVAFRRHWRPLVAGSAVLATIPLLLGDLAQVRLGDVISADVHLDSNGLPLPIPSNLIGELAAAIGLVIATELLSSAFLMLASLVASIYVARDYRGERTTLRVAFAAMLRRSPVALAVWFLSTAIGIALLALTVVVAVVAYAVLPPPAGSVGGPGAFIALIAIVGGIVVFAFVSIRLLVAPIVAVLEPDGGPISAMRRSWHLTAENVWRTFGLVAAVTLTVSVLVAIVAEFVALISGALVTGSTAQVVVGLVIGIGLALLTAPIVPVMETVLYFDLRVRRDGLTLPLPAEVLEGKPPA